MQTLVENVALENPIEPVCENEASDTSLDLKKLRTLRKRMRLTQADAAEMVGIHRTYFVLIESGKKSPSPRLRRAILEFMEKAERRIPSTPWERIRSSHRDSSLVNSRSVPVTPWSSAAKAIAHDDIRKEMEKRSETECTDPNAFAVIIEGGSMESKFLAGDCVVFAPNSEPRNGDVVLAKLKDGRLFLKYFYLSGPEGTRVKLVSENANYSPIEVDCSDLAFVYPAWEVKRQLRR